MKKTKTVATGEKSLVRTFCAPVPLDPGILADIITNPERDDLRLHAADWLIDHDQDWRAEFIQVQVAKAKLKEPEEKTIGLIGRYTEEQKYRRICSFCGDLPSGLCRYHGLHVRERWLLFHGDFESLLQGLPRTVWLEGSNEPAKFYSLDPDMGIVFRRGFVESLACTAADFLAHADALRAATPLREVTLTTWSKKYGTAVLKRIGDNGMWSLLGTTPITKRPMEDYLSFLYPGIRFHLPPLPIHQADWQHVNGIAEQPDFGSAWSDLEDTCSSPFGPPVNPDIIK